MMMKIQKKQTKASSRAAVSDVLQKYARKAHALAEAALPLVQELNALDQAMRAEMPHLELSFCDDVVHHASIHDAEYVLGVVRRRAAGAY